MPLRLCGKAGPAIRPGAMPLRLCGKACPALRRNWGSRSAPHWRLSYPLGLDPRDIEITLLDIHLPRLPGAWDGLASPFLLICILDIW